VPLWTLAIAAVPLAWLLPNHFYPWLSAWQEGPVLLLTALALVGLTQRTRLPWPWLAALVAAALSVGLQWAVGKIAFGGDALMVLVYLGAFAAALALGSALPEAAADSRVAALDAVAVGTVIAAVASVAVALVQWTDAVSLGIYAADLPPGFRPFGNLAQPNHLCTAAFLGLCSLAVLRECGRFGRSGFRIVALFLILGMVMSGSRTGWLQMLLLVLLALAMRRRVTARLRWTELLALVAVYAAATAIWPALNDALLLTGKRGLTEQIDGSGRWPLARALLDAVGRQPLWGYGWQQVASAQQAVAMDHPPIRRHFEHSHNMLLDLVIWAGIPVGGFIIAMGGLALARQLRATVDARALWLVGGALGVIAHAMVEFPLEYVYFLVPTGLMLGAAHRLSLPDEGWACPPKARRVGGALALLMTVAIGVEYMQAEVNHRMLRLETARIGTQGIETPAPGLRLLTQLEAFLSFARTEARPGMSAAEIEQMKNVSLRFAYAPAMFRYALAAGLNGDPAAAQLTLGRLCRIHLTPRCDEAREAWQSLQQRYPELASVRVP
jgi:hypothetical protein